MDWFHLIQSILLFGILVYAASVAQALQLLTEHNLKFAPPVEVSASPGNVLVKIGGETFPAHLSLDDEGCVELVPTKVGDIAQFEIVKDGLRS